MIFKYLKVYCIFIFIFLTFTLNANASLINSSNTRAIQPKITRNSISISNFFKVDKDFYRGAQPDLADFSSLSSLGIKTIINLRNIKDYSSKGYIKQKLLAENYGMKYISIPMHPSMPPTNEQIAYFFQIINNPDNLPVYIHCAQGRDRTGIMTALYRVEKYGWNYNEAYSEMIKRGYHSIIFPKHKKFLAEYIKAHNISAKIIKNSNS